jgi:hypothetical protein
MVKILWQKLYGESFMLFKICGVEVMKLLKKVDYTREMSNCIWKSWMSIKYHTTLSRISLITKF